MATVGIKRKGFQLTRKWQSASEKRGQYPYEPITKRQMIATAVIWGAMIGGGYGLWREAAAHERMVEHEKYLYRGQEIQTAPILPAEKEQLKSASHGRESTNGLIRKEETGEQQPQEQHVNIGNPYTDSGYVNALEAYKLRRFEAYKHYFGSVPDTVRIEP